jgi:3-methyladenine DNA glycosylase AlkD
MELIKTNWTKQDGVEFVKYLETLKSEEKINRTKNTVNTNMKVFAIKSPEINAIIKQIKKGNFLSFLDLELNNYYENTIINGNLIVSIKEFKIMKKYLDKYVEKIDNWASCDILKFNVKDNEENFMNLSYEYVKNKLPFVRRVGILILFKFIDKDKYIDKIFNRLNQFEKETEYYVNMINAWLVCELFIKRREETIEFLKDNKLNKFTINKAISKCRDSYRVSKEDKEMLVKFRK